MSAIISFLSECFGFVMNLLFQFFSAINYPYLWACIVAFAILARIITLPQKLSETRKSLISPVLNAELQKVKRKYADVEKSDKEQRRNKKNDTKAVYKKFKVKKGSGLLFTIVQLPIYIALFSVVKNPTLYIPALAESTNPAVNSFFGLQIDKTPQSLGEFAFLVPAFLIFFTLFKLFPSLKTAFKTRKKLHIIIPVVLLNIFIYATASMKLPLAISLYWISGDLINFALKKICVHFVSKNNEVKQVLNYIAAQKAKAAEEQRKPNEKKTASVEQSITTTTEPVVQTSN